MKISYDSTELIEDIREDILEFGADAHAWMVWKKMKYKIPFKDEFAEAEIVINYLLDNDGESLNPPTKKELEGGRAEYSTLGEIYKILIDQNSII